MVFGDGREADEVENERPLSAGGGVAAEQRQGPSLGIPRAGCRDVVEGAGCG